MTPNEIITVQNTEKRRSVEGFIQQMKFFKAPFSKSKSLITVVMGFF
jgi:hypothetical protein